MSVPMAIVDYIPVCIFLLVSLTLMHDMYHMMSKGAFALFSAGLIIIFVAGAYKATWKLLYALNICDFTALNNAFFPMQSTGFVLAALGMFGLLFFRQKSTAYVAAPAVYTSSLPFVAFTIIGTAGMWLGLSSIAFKMKKKQAGIMLVISFIFMLAMGYLSSRDFSDPRMNWIGEIVNIMGMVLLYISVQIMHKAGLETFELKHR